MTTNRTLTVFEGHSNHIKLWYYAYSKNLIVEQKNCGKTKESDLALNLDQIEDIRDFLTIIIEEAKNE